jgi:hypothetical protein
VGARRQAPQVPAFQFIELADLFQQQKSRGVNVGGKFGDFLAEAGQAEVIFGVR